MARPRRADITAPPEPDGKTKALTAAASRNGNGTRTQRRTAAQRRHDVLTAVREAYGRTSADEQQWRRVLTASSQTIDPSHPDDLGGAPNAVTRTWQHAAFGYTHTVPELGATKLWVGNALSQIRLRIGLRHPDGSVDDTYIGDQPEENDDIDKALVPVIKEAQEILSTVRSPMGGQSELLRAHGEKTFIAGEEYLLPTDTPRGIDYELLSTQELIPDGNGWTRYYGPGFEPKKLAPGVRPIRIWHPDTQYGKSADSSVRSSMEILEELVVLTRLVRASAISRMALSGVLCLPDELDFPEDDDAEQGELSEETSPLATDIINTGAKAIDDPASAAAFMPYVLTGPADFLDKVKHVAFQTDDHENSIKRQESLERLSHGLDVPAEVVLGFRQTTFANAYQIDINSFKLHLEPAVKLLCDALTENVLWPAIAGNRGINPEDLANSPYPDEIMKVCVTFDATRLIAQPDRSKEIIDLYIHDPTQMSVRIVEVREALGLAPDEAPDIEEITLRLNALRLSKIREVIHAPTSDQAVTMQDAADGKAVDPNSAAGNDLIGDQTDDEGTDQTATGNTDGPDGSGASSADDGGGDGGDFVTMQRAVGAAQMVMTRAAERVGSKLRQKVRGKSFTEAERTAIAGAPHARVAAILTEPTTLRILSPETPTSIVAGELVHLRRLVERWAVAEGFEQPTEMAQRACEAVSDLTLRYLFGEAGDPPDPSEALRLALR